MTQQRRYLIIAIIIMIIITLWVSRGQEQEPLVPTAMPINGMMEKQAGEAAMPSEPPMEAPAPAADMGMPMENAAEVDGVPAGAEVSGEAPTTDMPPPAEAAPAVSQDSTLPTNGQ